MFRLLLLRFFTLQVGPAILAGFEEGIARGWLHNITFSIEFWDTQCDNSGADDANENVLKKYRPHVMFGPSCDEALTAVAFNQYSSRKFPLLTAGGFGTIFTSQKYIPGSSYYMLTKTGISYRDVAKTFVRFMQENKWQKFLLAVKEQERLEWSGDRSCKFFAKAIEIEADHANITHRTLYLHDYDGGTGVPTLDQYIESNKTMLQQGDLARKNSR